MLAFLTEHFSSILVGLALLLIVALVIRVLIRDKKNGKSCTGCGGSCGGCPSAGACHHHEQSHS